MFIIYIKISLLVQLCGVSAPFHIESLSSPAARSAACAQSSKRTSYAWVGFLLASFLEPMMFFFLGRGAGLFMGWGQMDTS